LISSAKTAINKAIWAFRLSATFYSQLRPNFKQHSIINQWYLRLTNDLYRKIYNLTSTTENNRILIVELELGIYKYLEGVDFVDLKMYDPIDFWEPINLVGWEQAKATLLDNSLTLLLSSDPTIRKLGCIIGFHKKNQK